MILSLVIHLKTIQARLTEEARDAIDAYRKHHHLANISDTLEHICRCVGIGHPANAVHAVLAPEDVDKLNRYRKFHRLDSPADAIEHLLETIEVPEEST